MLEIIEECDILPQIQRTEQSLSLALLTRNVNYNAVKNYIAMDYSTMDFRVIESSRRIAERLRIGKSIVARVFLKLEEDGFLKRESWGNHPRQVRYVVAASKQECFLYRNFYSLSPYRRKKFFKNLETCGAKNLDQIVQKFFGRGYENQVYGQTVGV